MNHHPLLKWLLLALTGVLLGAFGLVPAAVQAQGPAPTPAMWITNPQGTRVPWNTPGGPGGNQPATTPGPGGGDGGWQLPNLPQVITQFIQHVLVFPAESLRLTLERAVAETLRGSLGFMRAPLTTALRYTIFSTPTILGGSLGPAGESILWLGQNPFEDAWRKVRTVTFFLYPLLLAIAGLTVVSRNALGASWQSEDLGEVLVRWFGIVLASGLSIYLCDWFNRLCNALAGLFLGLPSVDYIVDTVFFGAAGMLVVGSGPVVGLLLAVFMAVVGLLILFALIMQYVARYVLLYLLVAIAPLGILALGLDQTRWLGYLWIKGFVMVCLLQPLSALVFALLHMIAISGVLNGLVDPVGSFVKFAVAVGLLSVLITINYAVVRGVFGTIGEVAQKGKDTALAVGSMALRATLVLGGAVAGGIGLAGGALPALGGAAAGGGGAAAGGAGGATAGTGATVSGTGPAAGGTGATAGGTGPGASAAGSQGAGQGICGLNGEGLGNAMEGLGYGLFGSRSSLARTAGGLLRGVGGSLRRDAADRRRQGEQAARDEGREAAWEDRQTTQERRREYAGYARQMTPDPKTQTDVTAALDLLAQTWGHERVREALPPVANAVSLVTGGARGGGRTTLSRLAEERGYVSAAGTPLPAHFVAGEVERDLSARHGAAGSPAFAPPQPGRVGPDQAPPAAPSLAAEPPTYFDYRRGAQIAAALGQGVEREPTRVYGALYSQVRQTVGLAGTGPALADDLVAQAPAIAARAWQAGADPQAAFARHVDALADQHGLTSRDLGDAWTRHVGELRPRLEEA